jgi:hypothetical protein
LKKKKKTHTLTHAQVVQRTRNSLCFFSGCIEGTLIERYGNDIAPMSNQRPFKGNCCCCSELRNKRDSPCFTLTCCYLSRYKKLFGRSLIFQFPHKRNQHSRISDLELVRPRTRMIWDTCAAIQMYVSLGLILTIRDTMKVNITTVVRIIARPIVLLNLIAKSRITGIKRRVVQDVAAIARSNDGGQATRWGGTPGGKYALYVRQKLSQALDKF